nr:hypothetical protein [uncultured Cohaesibacter sp.]
MENLAIETALWDVARSIALDAEAIPSNILTSEPIAAFADLDTQILAYSIAKERVLSGAVPYDYPVLMNAIETVIAESKAMQA